MRRSKPSRNYHAAIDRRGGQLPEIQYGVLHSAPDMIVEMRAGGEYTGNQTGQIIRVDKKIKTKKERNLEKRLRRTAGL